MKLQFLACFLVMSAATVAQPTVPTNNEERIVDLRQLGVRIEGATSVAWFPKDSVSQNRMVEVLDSLDVQVNAARVFLKSPRDWQVFGSRPITFYFSRGNFVANASIDGDLFIPLWRMKSNKAPYMHEIMHVLLRSKSGNWNKAPREETGANMPMWLTEGLPEYLALRVAKDYNFPKFDVHRGGGLSRIDSTCQSSIKTEVGSRVLNYVGGKGVLLDLFGSNRATYAPPFYNCSCSFTKYLAEKYGLEMMLGAISDFKNENAYIERAAGMDMISLKQQWLLQIAKSEGNAKR